MNHATGPGGDQQCHLAEVGNRYSWMGSHHQPDILSNDRRTKNSPHHRIRHGECGSRNAERIGQTTAGRTVVPATGSEEQGPHTMNATRSRCRGYRGSCNQDLLVQDSPRSGKGSQTHHPGLPECIQDRGRATTSSDSCG